jgi:hypothetical protein
VQKRSLYCGGMKLGSSRFITGKYLAGSLAAFVAAVVIAGSLGLGGARLGCLDRVRQRGVMGGQPPRSGCTPAPRHVDGRRPG